MCIRDRQWREPPLRQAAGARTTTAGQHPGARGRGRGRWTGLGGPALVLRAGRAAPDRERLALSL
eukprot:1014141-Alexandrium_andersonii.AAC.1